MMSLDVNFISKAKGVFIMDEFVIHSLEHIGRGELF
jgi:hypothetical protein